MMKQLALFSLAAAMLAGCSTDLDINAEYKDISVVYGLLNQRDSVHMVKINKAFLGQGDATLMAMVADSNEYGAEDVTDARVIRFDVSGNEQGSYELHDTIIMDRAPGVFNAPVQKMYYFRTPFAAQLNAGRMFLYQDSRYELRATVKGRTIKAVTPICNDFSIDPVDQDTVQSGARVGLMNFNGTGYGSYEFNWKSRTNDKRFVVSYRFRYDEVRGSDTLHKAFEQRLGTRVTANSANQENLSVVLGGQGFFSSLAGYIKSDPTWSDVNKRIFRGLDFLVSVANDDFHTYLTLTEPVSGIIEDRPAYSNLDGAFGVWGSRYTKNVRGKRLNGNTLTELVEGQYTGDLRFCSALDPGGAFSCN